MTIIIRTDTKEPIQQQVYEQIKAQIFNRNLKPGSLIPSIRTLASELQISVITVKNAYDLLQKEGLILFLQKVFISLISPMKRLKKENSSCSCKRQKK